MFQVKPKKARETILIVATGGTIEALHYPQGTKLAPESRENSIIPDLLKKHSFNYPYDLKVPFLKDSRFLTNEDLESIFEIVKNTEHKKILISHGTMTLMSTHAFLKERVEHLEEKTVVLFGANMRSDLPNSDAGINLGFALGCCLYAEPSIYIGMNGILIKSQSCTI